MTLLELKLFVFHYKPESKFIEAPNYIHVWAGKNHSEIKTDLLGDDTGDHISGKNKYYSELTGLYWTWKNQQADIIGSCHYRRFFTNKTEPLSYKIKRLLYFPVGLYRKRFGLLYTNNLPLFEKAIITEPEIREIFETYDVILPQHRKFRYSVREHYRRYHDLRDLDRLEAILREKCPEYLPAFESVMNGNRLYANNMFVLKRDDHERFMSWWFGILSEFENRMHAADYVGYQQRILGFLGERLLTIWIYHQNFKVKELLVIYFKKLKKANVPNALK